MDDFLFSDTVKLLARSGELRAQRHNVIAGNIANAETPGYTPKSLHFEKQLKTALEAQSKGTALASRHPRHLQAGPALLENVQGAVVEDPGAAEGVDGNGVDVENEMAKMAKNQIMYYATIQLLARKLEGLKNVIRGGN